MPVIDFVPTSTQISVEIKSAADLVQFAKDYNAFKYDGVDPLVVHVTEDIVFDDATNAAWEPIGGKFADGRSLYWSGKFEGNNHKIKNWVSSKPLFGFSYQGSVVKNVIIDASCTLTATAEAAVDGVYYSPILTYAKGEVENDGSIPIDEDDIDPMDRCLEITVDVVDWAVELVYPEF